MMQIHNKLTIGLAIILFFSLLSSLRGKTITIMSANLTSGDHQAYEASGMRILKGLNPDIVLIQEFNYQDGTIDSFVDEVFGTDFHYYREPGKSLPNGIISRWPIKDSGNWNDLQLSDREFAWAIIDIPGDKDLQAVSVHLKAGADAEDVTKRKAEATSLEKYISDNFDPAHYIVVGGDLNIQSYEEETVDYFNNFLNATTHIPRDTNNPPNSNTNRDQNKPYDWIMPNSVLDDIHNNLVIGENSFTHGLVFNSWYYTPLSDISKVEKGDSFATNMQHMAVMKAFEIPTSPQPAGDYNGDGTSDLAIWRPSNGLWSIRNLTRIYFGESNDTPIPQDYDGDGTWDLAFFRSSYGLWKIKNQTRFYFGTTGDQPIPGDYNGDQRADLAYFRATASSWKIKDQTKFYFGSSEDIVIPADYSGDGTLEAAYFRPASGLWKTRNHTRIYFGTSSDQPIPGDYNGDGSADFAFFRPDSGLWKILNLTRIYFGTSEDIPVPADFNGDGTCDFSFFRPKNILWKIKDITKVYFGQTSDIPMTNPSLD